MANESGENSTGFELSADVASFLGDLGKAEQALDSLAKKADDTTSKINKDFSSTNLNNVDAFVKKITEASTAMSKMNSSQSSKSSAIEELGSDAVDAAGKINELNNTLKSSGINKIPSSTSNMDEKGLTSINEKLKQYTLLLSGITKEEATLHQKVIYSDISDEITRLNTKKAEEITYQREFNALVKETANAEKQAQIEQIAINESKQEYNSIGIRSIEIEQLKAKYSTEEVQSKREALAAAKESAANDKQAAAQAKELAKAEKEKASAQKAAEKTLASYNKAMNMSEASLSTRSRKIDAINTATKNLKNTEGDHTKELDKASIAVKRLHTANQQAIVSTKSMSKSFTQSNSTLKALIQSASIYFSVNQVKQFLRSMVQVRGEFELQQKALQAILKDKYAANKLFAQITELSVSSPFRLKGLLTYTKQLAAYRVETSKLFETTKQLADVSAGLGVDMNRLILAYGQVKAANYLRGTELRQFSEAGINILGELSDKFTELEGHAVSVGDIFEKVSRRMVSFQDVADVFDDLTKKGGMFYKMQEIQANTVLGMINNLKDALDIMYNDIGKQSEGAIKSTLDLLRYVMMNWETIANIIKPLILGFTTYKTISIALLAVEQVRLSVSKLMVAYTAKQAIATQAVTVAQTEFNLAAKANPYILIGSIIIGAVYAISEAIGSASAEQEKFNKITNESLYEASKLSGNFRNLAEAAVNAADGSNEQKEALDELHRTYKDILPTDYLKIEALRAMKGRYDDVTESIYSYINAKNQEEMISSANETLRKDVMGSEGDLVDKLIEKGVDKIAAKSIIQNAISDALAGKIKLDNDSFRKHIEELTLQSENVSLSLKEYRKLMTSSTSSDKLFTEIEVGPSKEIRNAVSLLVKYKDTMVEINNSKITPIVDFKAKELKTQLDDMVNTIDKEIKNAITSKKWNETVNPFDISNLKKDVTKKYISQFTQTMSDAMSKASDVDKIYYTNIINDANKIGDKFSTGHIQDEINNLIITMTEADSNLSKNDMFKYLIKEGQSFDEYTKDIEGSYKEMSDIFAKVSSSKAISSNQIFADLKGVGSTEEYDKLKATYDIISKIRENLVVEKDTSNKEESAEKKRLNSRISLLKKMNSEYDKLIKYKTKDEAKSNVANKYSDAASAVGVPISNNTQFDKAGTISSLNKIAEKAKGDVLKTIQQAVASIKVDIDVDVSQDKLDKLSQRIDKSFSDYNMSLDLDNINVPKDLQESLFGITPTSLKELRTTIESYENEFIGTDGEKAYNNYLKKIEDLEKKSISERAKSYIKYFTETLSEKEQIETKYNDLVASINDTDALSDSEKELAIYRIGEEKKKEIAKSSYEDFKNTYDYQSVFEDMSSMSIASIKRVKKELNELKSSSNGDLAPTDLRAINDSISKLDDTLVSRNPFTSLAGGINEYRKALTETKNAQDEYDSVLEESTHNSASAASAQKKLKQVEKESGKNSKEYKKAESDFNKEKLKSVKSTDKLSVAHDNLKQAFAKGGKATDKVKAGIEGITTYASEAGGAVVGLMSAFGASDEAVSDTQNVMQAIQGAGDMAGGMAKMYSGDIMGGAVQAAQGLASVVTAFNSMHDAKYEKIINKQKKLVEELEDKYDDLGDAIEKAYDFEDLSTNYADKKKTIEEENEAYEKMIAAEKHKKAVDNDQIKEWQKAEKENITKLEELEQERAEAFGGLDVQSAAQDFTDAWYEAFYDTGSGLTALKDKFDDFLKNLLQKQALLTVSEKYVKPIVDKFNEFVGEKSEGGERVTTNEMNELRAMRDDSTESIDGYFTALNDALDIKASTFSSTDLSGLQQGIQGVTEATAGVIESYLNSLRYFATERNSYLGSIKNILENQYGSGSDNQMIIEVKAIRALVNQMNNNMSDIIKSSSVEGGKGIRVFMA